MTGSRNTRRRFARLAIIALLTVQFVIFERALLNGTRFSDVPGSRALFAALVALVWLLAVASLTVWRERHRIISRVAVASVVLLSLRFYAPAVLSAVLPDAPEHGESMAVNVSPQLVLFLRELVAAQEQYRLRHHEYSASMGSLREWAGQPAGSSVQITVRGDTGWSARASLTGARCRVWVRDSTLRADVANIEGSPHCGSPEMRGTHQRIQSVTVPPSPESPFTEDDIGGRWLEHRADEHRSGVLHGAGISIAGRAWTRPIGGAIRAPVAIAGNQVFAGAHGNGELVALSLDSGKVGFRIRVPNWVHHEPAVTEDLLVVGFGNNEPSALNPSFIGSPPSGIAVYDRRTGLERWRRYTNGSVMTTPVVAGPLVAVVTGAKEAVAWRLADGREAWRSSLPDFSPMGNPLVVDTLLVVGVEPTSICALGIQSGRRIYCRALAPNGWGAGHASPAIAGDAVLQVYEEDLDGTAGVADGRVMFYARKIFGIPPRRHVPRPANALREQVLVALRWRDGRELWRTRLGPGRTRASGHIAGTPAVAEGVAYVPSPANRRIAAVETSTGRLLWSAAVNPARGSVLVADGAVIAATADTALVVLDARTGVVRCRQRLPQPADRAGPTLGGSTAVLTLGGGLVMARPLADWVSCRA